DARPSGTLAARSKGGDRGRRRRRLDEVAAADSRPRDDLRRRRRLLSPADRVLAYRLQGAGRRRCGAKARAAELLEDRVRRTRRSTEFHLRTRPAAGCGRDRSLHSQPGAYPCAGSGRRSARLVRCRANSLATRTASIMLPKSARRCQARSNAVPWATLVRTIGSPSVTFTARCMPNNFKAMWPWSRYMATTASNSPSRARTISVSAG